MYGDRGRIGLITLATDTGVLPEIQRLLPEGVQAYPAPIILPRGEVTPEALAEMLATDDLESAAALLAWAGVGAILFACTTGSLVHGPGWDQTLIARITGATGIKATTTATAVLDALRAMGASRLAVATPYLPALNEIEKRFLEQSGFAVAAIEGLSCPTDPEIGRLGPDDAIALAERVDQADADAIFVSCTNWHVVEAVPEMEARFGKPVVTSNLAGAWAMLRAIGIDESNPRHGRLFGLSLRLDGS
jgi:maleate isomerase